MGLEKDIGREIGNMVCGADTEELCVPYQEIWGMGNYQGFKTGIGVIRYI